MVRHRNRINNQSHQIKKRWILHHPRYSISQFWNFRDCRRRDRRSGSWLVQSYQSGKSTARPPFSGDLLGLLRAHQRRSRPFDVLRHSWYGRFLRLSSWRQRVLLYWTGNHHAFLLESARWRTVHPEISINTYRTLGFEWFNWGQIARLSSLSGNYWTLVEPSDDVVQDWSPLLGSPDAFDSSICYVSVSYNVQNWIDQSKSLVKSLENINFQPYLTMKPK